MITKLSGVHEYSLEEIKYAVIGWSPDFVVRRCTYCSSLLVVEFHGRFRTAQCEDDDIKINAARMGGGE